MKKLLSSILVLTMLFTMFVPVSFAGTADYELNAGFAEYNVTLGDSVAIPFNFVSNVDNKTTGLIQFTVTYPTAMGTPTYTLGSLTANDAVTPYGEETIVFEEKVVTHNGTTPLFTLSFAPTATGTYNVAITNIEIYDEDFNLLENVEITGATVVVADNTPAAPTLSGIDVKPDTLTVPYANQGAGIQAFVEDAITSVTATYSDGTTAPATSYTVAVSGNVATVTYEGVADTIALTLESAPTPPPATDSDYELNAGGATYNIELGNTLVMPIFFKSNVENKTTGLIQFTVKYPAAMGTPVYALGSLTANDAVTPYAEETIVFEEKVVTHDGTTPLFTFNFTPTSAGTYNVEITNIEIYDEDFNLLEDVTITGATVTVTAGGSVEPPAPTLTGITVAPTAIEIPYGTENDAKYVGENITIKAVYSNGDEVPVTDGFNVEVANNVATVTYNGVSATVAVTYEAAPAPTVQSISASPETLVIPYGTADVVEFVRSKVSVTAAMSDGTAQPVSNYSIQITGNEALITYEGQTATVALTQTVVTDVTSSVEQIVVPYGTEDVDAYIKANVGTITVHFSDNTTKVLEPSEYTVQVDPGSSAAVYFGTTGRYVKIPVHVVTLDCVMVDLEAEDRTIELPWDLAEEDVDAFIKAKLTVSAIYSYGDPVTVPAADYSIVEFVLSGEPVENSYTVSYEGMVSADNFYVVRGQEPVSITGINVVEETLVIPYGTEDIVAYIKANISVKTLESDGGSNPVTAFEVALDGNVATVTYEGFDDTLTIIGESVEEIYADKDAIEIPYTVDPADADAVNAYILENVKAYYKYSHNTQDALVAAEDIEIAIEASSGVATLTVGIFTTTINVTFEPVPEYILDEVVNETTGKVYAIDGAKLLVFTDVMAGKAILVNGVPATYVGNNTYAYVVVGDYQITTADMAAAPVAVEFGKLHNSEFVTAFDALLALNKGLGNAVEVFDTNIQNYILADIDGDGVIDATDAQMINNISLGKTVNTWVD